MTYWLEYDSYKFKKWFIFEKMSDELKKSHIVYYLDRSSQKRNNTIRVYTDLDEIHCDINMLRSSP